MKKLIAAAVAATLSASAFALPGGFTGSESALSGDTDASTGVASTEATTGANNICAYDSMSVTLPTASILSQGEARLAYSAPATENDGLMGILSTVGYSQVSVQVDSDYSAGFTGLNGGTVEAYTGIAIGIATDPANVSANKVSEEITGTGLATWNLPSPNVGIIIDYLAVYGEKGFSAIDDEYATTFTITCL